MTEQEVITPGSGNVFLDMGLKPEEAAVLALRADLMGRLRLMVRDNGWTKVTLRTSAAFLKQTKRGHLHWP